MWLPDSFRSLRSEFRAGVEVVFETGILTVSRFSGATHKAMQAQLVAICHSLLGCIRAGPCLPPVGSRSL